MKYSVLLLLAAFLSSPLRAGLPEKIPCENYIYDDSTGTLYCLSKASDELIQETRQRLYQQWLDRVQKNDPLIFQRQDESSN
jgi:hypothetical protein